MATRLRVYTVKAEGEPGTEPVLVHQIEILCDACGTSPLRYVIPGHHLKMVRDVAIELVDQFPDESGKPAGPPQNKGSFTVGGGLAKKPEDN